MVEPISLQVYKCFEFSFWSTRSVVIPELKKTSLPDYLSIAGGRLVEFISFSSAIITMGNTKSRSEFEFGWPVSLPTTVTVTLRAPINSERKPRKIFAKKPYAVKIEKAKKNKKTKKQTTATNKTV